MALNEISVFRGDRSFYGRKNFEEQEGNLQYVAYEFIRIDLLPYFDTEQWIAAYAEVKLLFEITNFDESVVQRYGGYPSRWRFGSYTILNADVNYQNEFITYEKQQSSKLKTFLTPEVVPISAFAPESALVLENTGVNTFWQFQFDLSEKVVGTGFEVQLNQGVTANIQCVYSGQMIPSFELDVRPIQTYVNI